MAVPQAPPYPGFEPYVSAGGGYSQQQFPHPGANPYPPGQIYQSPGQQYAAGQPYPGQYPQDAYPSSANNAGFAYYGPPATIVPEPMNYGGGEQGKFVIVFVKQSQLADKAICAVFIRKMYAMLMVQLLFTLAVIALFVFEENTNMFVRRYIYLYYGSYLLFIVVYIALFCCESLRRQYPTNMVLLSVFTICLSCMLGTMSAYYNTDIILMTVGICAGVCLFVTVLSFYSQFDFTSCGTILSIFVWMLCLLGIITIFTHITYTMYAACGAFLFVAFLICDTLVLISGKRHEVNSEEHIFAVIQIYLDIVCIVCIFMCLCRSR